MPHDDERALRHFLKNAHRALDPKPPGFEATLAAARRRGDRRGQGPRMRWRIATAVAAVAAVTLTLVGLGLFDRHRPMNLDPTEALQLAESLRSWRGPTDFLHRPPGADLLESLPRLHWTTTLTDARAVAEALAAAEMEKTP